MEKNKIFTNQPKQNWYAGLFTGLFCAFCCAFIVQGMEFLEIKTSLTGPFYKIRDNLPFFIAYAIGTVVFFILMRVHDKSTYEDIERNIDD